MAKTKREEITDFIGDKLVLEDEIIEQFSSWFKYRKEYHFQQLLNKMVSEKKLVRTVTNMYRLPTPQDVKQGELF